MLKGDSNQVFRNLVSRHGLETKQGTLKIDRAHRALGPPKENIYRPVIIKLHNFNGSLLWLGRKAYQGSRIYILSIGPSKGSQVSVHRGLQMADPGRNTVPNALPSQLMLHFQWRGARRQKSMWGWRSSEQEWTNLRACFDGYLMTLYPANTTGIETLGLQVEDWGTKLQCLCGRESKALFTGQMSSLFGTFRATRYFTIDFRWF